MCMLLWPLVQRPLVLQTATGQSGIRAPATLTLLRGPTVHFVTDSTARVVWRTSEEADSTIHYGDTTEMTLTVINATPTTEHRVFLTGLTTDTRYYYKVVSGGVESDVFHFRTAPPDGEEFRLVALGDNRPSSSDAPIQPAMFSQIADMVVQEEPHMVVMTGDYVLSVTTDDTANREAWAPFMAIVDRIGHYAPVYAVLGNHDTGSSTGTRRLQYFFDTFELFDEPATYSSFDYAGVHFVLLDSEELGKEGRITGAQYEWLVEDLAATDAYAKFVFVHRPLYPLSHVGSALDVNVTERDRLQHLFEEENVTLVVAGHDHLYDRMTVNSVIYVITGGAGAPLYNTPWGGAYYHYTRVTVSRHRINITAVRTDGSCAASYALPYTGPIEIFLRETANASTKANGTMPRIYFSQQPEQVYYSWDGGTNTTALTGLPDIGGEHVLNVYACDTEGRWSTARFVFYVRMPTTYPGPTHDTETPPTDLETVTVAAAGVAGIAALAVVVVLLKKKR